MKKKLLLILAICLSGLASFAQSVSPTSQTVCQGATVSITVSGSWYHRTWYKLVNGNSQYAGGGATLTLTNVQPGQSGQYFCRVETRGSWLSSGSTYDSDVSTLTIQPTNFVAAPSVSGTPVCTGQSIPVSFNTTCADGFGGGDNFIAELSNQNGDFTNPVTSKVVQPGTSNSLPLPDGLPGGSGYQVRIRSVSPAIISPESEAFGINARPTLGGVAQAATVCSGSSATIQLSGLLLNSSMSVAYSIAGVDQTPVSVISKGHGLGSFTVSSLSNTLNGQALVITGLTNTTLNPSCNVPFSTNNSVTLSVDKPPVGGTLDGPGAVCFNSTATLERKGWDGVVKGLQTSPNQVDWQTVSTSSDVTVTTAALTSATYFRSILGRGVCPDAFSTPLLVMVNPLPTAQIQGTTTVCQGSSPPSVTFTGSNGTTPYTFTYQLNGGSSQTITTSNGSLIALPRSTDTPGTFAYTLLSVEDANQCSQAVSAQAATVTVLPLRIPTAPTLSSAVLCAGQYVGVSFSTGDNCPAPVGNPDFFKAELSDASGNFPGTILQPVQPNSSTNVLLPAGLAGSVKYRIRIIGTNPNLQSPPSSAFGVTALAFTSTPTVAGVPVCIGGSLTATYTLNCPAPFPSDYFKVQLSNASGSFANPKVVGPLLPGGVPMTIPVETPAGSGYRLRVVGGNGLASNQSAAFRVRTCTNNSLALPSSGEETGLQVLVSPNPVTQGLMDIQVRGAGGQEVRLLLSNLAGVALREQVIPNAQAEESLRWDIARQPPGLYLLRVSSGQEVKTVKVVR
ncbi:MAG: T9SS type A sorting domain-containing protein [Cytophagaceae bacterium]|nr:T9SS type A sorting domain-containing protein [Cytophagaceae bacterium]